MERESEGIVFNVCMVHSYKSFKLKVLYTRFKAFIIYTVNSAQYNRRESTSYAFLREIILYKAGKCLKKLWCCVGGRVSHGKLVL